MPMERFGGFLEKIEKRNLLLIYVIIMRNIKEWNESCDQSTTKYTHAVYTCELVLC